MKVLISRNVVFQEFCNGVVGDPPCGVTDLISDVFKSDLLMIDSFPSTNAISVIPSIGKAFDLIPVVKVEKGDEPKTKTVQFKIQKKKVQWVVWK